jgi:hypothetical protein
MPDWMQGLQTSAVPDLPSFGTETGASGSTSDDWLSALQSAAPGASTPEGLSLPDDAPDWLNAMGTGALPAESGAAPAEAADWMSALRTNTATEVNLPGEAAMVAPNTSGLEEAALPSWLASIRPVDVGSSASGDDEADAYEERVGVLAGMRGVLRAEPVVAQPRKSLVQVQKLAISKEQATQAQVLSDLLAEANQTRPTAKRRPAYWPIIERVLVVLALMLAVFTTLQFSPNLFPLPQTIDVKTSEAYTLLDQAPPQKPVLVIFDYEPAQAGELEPGATAIIKHLLLRGITVVGASTQPVGAALGNNVLEQVAVDLSEHYSYTYGTHYLTLGYIPGGAVGIGQFAANPSGIFPNTPLGRDFRRDLSTIEGVWHSPALSAIDPTSLNSFGVIVLVAASPETVRAWMEQAQPRTTTNIVAVISAGAEPLVRPYAEGNAPQLKGLVTGLAGAAQYQGRMNVSSSLRAEDLNIMHWNWDAVSGGSAGAVALLFFGNVIAGVLGVLRSRRRR